MPLGGTTFLNMQMVLQELLLGMAEGVNEDWLIEWCSLF